MRRQNGFTLVELLVVVGVISILIALLLPALNKAREAAKGVQCLSQLRQIYLGVVSYANANRGMIAASYEAGRKPSPRWPNTMPGYLPQPDWPDAGRASHIWVCPTVAGRVEGAVGPASNHVRWTYLRMQNSKVGSTYPLGTGGDFKITQIKHPSEKIFLIDGILATPPDMSSGAVGNQSGGMAMYSRIHNNVIDRGTAGFIHNHRANVLFLDGHARPMLRSEITQEMCDIVFPE